MLDYDNTQALSLAEYSNWTFTYEYIIFQDEVTEVWSNGSFTGKLLFFVARLSIDAADGAFSLCLYAFLGLKKKHFALLSVILVVTSLSIMGLRIKDLVDIPVPSSAEDGYGTALRSMGYACSFDLAENYPSRVPISYIAFTRVALYAVMGIGSFWREDRAGRPILAVLQRDGGLYLLTRTILEVVILVTFGSSGAILPMSLVKKMAMPYIICYALNVLTIPLFTGRLLVNMMKAANPDSSGIGLSSLHFLPTTTYMQQEDPPALQSLEPVLYLTHHHTSSAGDDLNAIRFPGSPNRREEWGFSIDSRSLAQPLRGKEVSALKIVRGWCDAHVIQRAKVSSALDGLAAPNAAPHTAFERTRRATLP
ncbi:hypothetical protein DFP72DRAFT_861732 [Ephemerocybe angulata]|uniref:Uncharacterized protein n=1 Tax=Ephemerocybe angulata TaxID=980116 RepID=A0A8H6H9A1_9AGAR|nr:hypothetical protein DFP72DRAFT_861732 [Tulosesus angulatus]